jgi:CheY-like chemotaxis protein
VNPDPHPQPPAEKRRKILVVDDNAVIVKTLSFKLKASGFDVCTAMDGADAVSKVRTERPDLILLDISFPTDVGGGVAWDGFLVMDWLRRMEEAKHTPMIVITGGDPVQFEKRALDAGATAFFHKPLDHAGLIDVIRRTLRGISIPPPSSSDTTFTP